MRCAFVVLVCLPLVSIACARPDRDWPAHGGDPGHTQYSSLDQITPSNVQQLRVAWTYRTGDARAERSEIQCNPIVVHGVMYATSPQLKAFALDAGTGKRRWVFDPFKGSGAASSLGVNRGLVFWENGDDQRIFFAAGEHVYAIDAKTGNLITRA